MFRTELLINMFGIRRSGNHLIGDWLVGQLPDSTAVGKNVQIDYFYFLHEWQKKNQYLKCFLVQIEEHPIGCVEMAYSEYADAIKKIVILRDPYNLFASRIKHYKIDKAPFFNDKFVTYHWVDYARYFLNHPSDVICVSYNHFCKDISYRRSLCAALGRDFNSEKDLKFMNQINSRYSGGSSFDRAAYDGKGSEMKTLDRWEIYKDDPNYRCLFTDEIKMLSEQIFGFNPL